MRKQGESKMHTTEALLRLDAVKARCGLGRSTIYALIAEDRFPSPIHIRGTRVSVWSASAIEQWIATQIEEAA